KHLQRDQNRIGGVLRRVPQRQSENEGFREGERSRITEWRPRYCREEIEAISSSAGPMSDDPITTSLRTPWTTTVDSAAALERRVALQGEQIRLLGSAIHVAGEGIAILTPAVEAIGPRIAFVNDGFLALYRCERTDVIGQTPLAFGIIPEHDAILNAVLQHVFSSQPFDGEATARRKDGSRFELDVQLIP